jgi:hypothetical protein
MKNSEGEPRKRPKELLEAGGEFLSGSPGSDESFALGLLFLAEIETATHPAAVSMASFYRREWLEKSLQAVRTDYNFFRRVAKILKAERKAPRADRAQHFVHLAYMRLYEDPNVDADKITKHDVKTMAKRWWAFSRLSHNGKISGSFQDTFDDESEKRIDGQIHFFPTLRWQGIWKRPEFAGLKDAKRGPKEGKTKAGKKASKTRHNG